MDKTILIAGADGFIGSNMYSRFKSRYDTVLGTVYYTGPEAGLFYVDLTEPETLKNIPLRYFDCCINAAGTVDQSVPPEMMRKINGKGTKLLLDRLAETGCGHFIQLSSIAVYGKRVVGMNRDEGTKRKKRGLATIPYGRAKAEAEVYIEESGIPYTMLRLPPVLGEKDTALTPAVRKRLEKRDPFTCSRKNKKVSILHVCSLPGYVDQIIRLGPQNDVFNAASHHMDWESLLDAYLREWCGNGRPSMDIRKKWKYSFLFHFRDKDYLLNSMFSAFGSHFPTDKLEQIISLETEYSCAEGVREALNACFSAVD